jgi:TonB family protein
MSKIVAQSLFHTTEVQASWRSQATSAVIHGVLIAMALLITLPVVRESRKAQQHITLIAPLKAVLTPKIQPVRKMEIPHLSARLPVLPPVIKAPPLKKLVAENPPPVVVPPPVKVIAEQPAVVVKVDNTRASQPARIMEAAKAPAIPKVQVGGFGDPNAVRPAESRPAPVVMAKVGSFESVAGAGQSGAAGQSGTVKLTTFGNAESAAALRNNASAVQTGSFGNGSATGPGANVNGRGPIKSSGFGDTVAAAPAPKTPQPTAAPVFTPVEILYKPKPTYSAEARNMRVEGQVSLEVVFQASGSVKVVRVIRGLGHGLDEAAQQAALQVRFKPAKRAGIAVDQSATISITFELT